MMDKAELARRLEGENRMLRGFLNTDQQLARQYSEVQRRVAAASLFRAGVPVELQTDYYRIVDIVAQALGMERN